MPSVSVAPPTGFTREGLEHLITRFGEADERRAAFARFASLPASTTRGRGDPAALALDDLRPFAASDAAPAVSTREGHLVIVDGAGSVHLDPVLASSGVRVTTFRQAAGDAHLAAALRASREHLALEDDSRWAALTRAFATDGAYIHVPDLACGSTRPDPRRP